MSRWKELDDFEKRFPERMDVDELRRWRAFFAHRAQFFQPKVRKLAMKRVHAIDSAIADRERE